MGKGLVQNLALALGSVVAFLLLAEISLRLFAPRQDSFIVADPYVGHTHTPNAQYYLRPPEGLPQVEIKTNSHGFRERELPHRKEPGTFRIVVLGDSFIEGATLPWEDAFPQVLEKRLNAQSAGRRFEVLGLGISAYGTRHEYLALKHYGRRYEPDLVILAFFTGNDVWDNSMALRGAQAAQEPYFVLNEDDLELRWQVRSGFASRLQQLMRQQRLQLYYLGRDVAVRFPLLQQALLGRGPETLNPMLVAGQAHQGIPEGYFIYAARYPPPWEEAWEITRRLIAKTKREAEAAGAEFVVLIIPAQEEVEPDAWEGVLRTYPAMPGMDWDLENPHRTLIRFLEETGASYVPLLPEFRGIYQQGGQRLYYEPPDAHWNALGHRTAAEITHRELTRMGLVR